MTKITTPKGCVFAILVVSFTARKCVLAQGGISSTCQTTNTAIPKSQTAVLTAITDTAVYDMRQRPNTAAAAGRSAATTPDDIQYILGVNSIVAIDQVGQQLTLSVYETITWADDRLTFDQKTNAECIIGTGAIECEEKDFMGGDKLVWTPSTYVVNQRSKTTDGVKMFYVSSSGSITWRNQMTLGTSCPMNFGRYPFDSHSCSITVSTFSQSANDINIIAGLNDEKTDLLDLTTFMSPANFKKGEFDVSSTSTTTSYTDCNGMVCYKYLVGTLSFSRDYISIAQSTLIPDLTLHLIIWGSFFIDAGAAPARVTLCVIAALSFRIMMSSLFSHLPPVDYDIWLVDYMMASQIFAIAALVYYAVFIQFARKQEVARKALLTAVSKCGALALVGGEFATEDDLFEAAQLRDLDFKSKHRGFARSKTSVVSKVSPRGVNSNDPLQNVEAAEGGNDNTTDPKTNAWGSSPSKSTATSLNFLDVLIIARVRRVFDSLKGQANEVNRQQLKVALRQFGLFYSSIEVDHCIERLRNTQGRSLWEAPNLGFPDFFRLVSKHADFSPFADPEKPALSLSQPPSIMLDRVAILVYPVLIAAKIGAFALVLDGYST